MEPEHGVEKMVWMCSCLGYNMKYNGAISFARDLLAILQNHYPERLGALFCFDAPWIFRSMWKLVSPFVDGNTLKKIFFVQGSIEERQDILREFFDLDELQKDFGIYSSLSLSLSLFLGCNNLSFCRWGKRVGVWWGCIHGTSVGRRAETGRRTKTATKEKGQKEKEEKDIET